MKNSKQLKEERKIVADRITELRSKIENEKREATEAELNALEADMNEEDSLTRSIEVALQLEKRAAASAGHSVKTEDENLERNLKGFSLSKLIRESMAGQVTGLEKEAIEESAKEARSLGAGTSGIYLSNGIINVHKRTMVAGTAGAGGNFIPTEKLGFFDALFAMSAMGRAGAVSLTGLAANADLTGFSVAPAAGWAAETGTQSPADATTVARELRPKLLYGATDISRQLLIQTNNSIEAQILNSILKSMQQAYDIAVINGDGSNKPTGILGTSGIQNVAMGTNGGAPTLAKVLELVSAVGNANADLTNAKFIANSKTVGKLKQVPIDAGSGAMLMAYNQYFGGLQGVIDGYEVVVSNNAPSNLTKGSSSGVCSALLFGDFSQVVTAQFGGVELLIDSNSAAMARTGKVGLTVNMFVDSALKQPAAVGAILDLTTT